MSKGLRIHRVTRGIGLFKLGIETFRYEDEAHFSWGSMSLGGRRVWAVSFGLWEITWEGRRRG